MSCWMTGTFIPILKPKPAGDGYVRRKLFLQTFPVDTTVAGLRYIGEDGVLLHREHSVRIGSIVGSGCHAKEAVLRVDGS